MPGLIVREVSVRFGGLSALQDVSIEVAPREVIGVIGPNGAGKTTLFNVISGFVRPSSGTLVFPGQEHFFNQRPTAWSTSASPGHCRGSDSSHG